jgi:hypothetical protein
MYADILHQYTAVTADDIFPMTTASIATAYPFHLVHGIFGVVLAFLDECQSSDIGILAPDNSGTFPT